MSHEPLIRRVEDWLIAEALRDPDILELFEQLCERLRGLGLPLDRAVLSWPTLHPLFRAEQIFWRTDEGAKLEQYYHSSAGSAQYLASPFHHAQTTGQPVMRRRLSGDGALVDFDVLRELSDKGYSDYLLTATRFRIADVANYSHGPTGMMASWATRSTSGFNDDDLEALQRIQRVLAVACRSAIQKRVMSNLAAAYLGPTAGSRVLAGNIRRGDGAVIRAIVWFSDLRGSTRHSEAMDADSYLALLNRYFECTAQPVIDRGGEVLNFIGDGVLAIFPIDGQCPRDAAARAEEAAREAMRLGAEATPDPRVPPFRFGVGLSVGEIKFGNIGVPGRLAFSAIGHVVNEVHRVEKATARTGQPVLATAAFAELAPGSWTPAGRLDPDEFPVPTELFGFRASAQPAEMDEATG
ncbi:adenylate/guanylate cyclase domain-containing protein [Limibaculum sp. M0105]|uniref:Adenylate/guanylate cyclase domain-containing protein n=1 Tax=Thermohalobaculum xanthum TaxID=2753746 RepID=A0A8J7M5F6_9RHOB|nr:adenylate/guanylate cyclase domain-containing protein [Thermohalobaculum xanthum]MBK0398603.1 adenylate/guanylate cyclase domain-containing protein [Thermohalobaculum xanthum]